MTSWSDIAKRQDIRYFLVSFVDLFGAMRAKLVPASAMDTVAEAGAGFAGFAAWFDMTPADPDVLVHFAEVAVEFGDIEGAISALERLLLIDAEQPEVKLELGVLYYRLGSTEVARTYLQDVSSSKEASNESKERANTFLKEMKQP